MSAQEVVDTLRRVFEPFLNVDWLSERLQESGVAGEEVAADRSRCLESFVASPRVKSATATTSSEDVRPAQNPPSLDEAIELTRYRQRALLESSTKTLEALLVEDKEKLLTRTMDTLAKAFSAVLARLTDVSRQQTHDTVAQRRPTPGRCRGSHTARWSHHASAGKSATYDASALF